MTNNDITNLTLEEINECIIYAPNSSGKTRLANKLANENDNVLLFTSSTIENLLAFSGRSIHVGVEAKLVTRNLEIERQVTKSDFGKVIKEIYHVSSAKELASKSFIFSFVNIKKINGFDLATGVVKFLERLNVIKKEFDPNLGLFIDQNLSKELYDKVIKLLDSSIPSEFEIEKHITKDEFDRLMSIFNLIGSETKCPLCGYDWKDNEILKNNIKENLESYRVLENNTNLETLKELISLFTLCNNYARRKVFETNDRKIKDLRYLSENFKILLGCVYSFAENLIDKSDVRDNTSLLREHAANVISIDKEKDLRVKTNSFENDVCNTIKEIIVLPEGFKFVPNDGTIKIENNKGNLIDPVKFLSESEKRRLCIAILFTEVKSRDTRFLLLDDPADSNDDYYFDNLINLIIDFINNNTSLSWAVLTHEVRVPFLFAKEQERLIYVNQDPGYKYLFYLPDPSDSGDKKPPLSCFRVSYKHINIINEHEVVLFRKIFNRQTDYEVDPELAILSSFNQCRGLYNELLKQHKIKNKEPKRLKNKIKLVEHSYEHYVFNHKKAAKFYDLYLMNKMSYLNSHINPIFNIRKFSYAYEYRKRFLKRKYSTISSTNALIKYILYTVLRVLECHFSFERKLGEWAKANVPLFSCHTFENTYMIFPKLNYVEGLTHSLSSSIQSSFLQYKNLYIKSRKLLNDFSHSASMMFPPFLSVNPLDITRLEISIKKLP